MNKSAELISFERDFNEIVSSDESYLVKAFILGRLKERALNTFCNCELSYALNAISTYLHTLFRDSNCEDWEEL